MAESAAQTDWARIVSIYDLLLDVDHSPVVELARAVAVGRAEGAAAGLAALPAIEGSPYGEAARGVFLAELGQRDEARRHFEKAKALARTGPERRLMERRLPPIPGRCPARR
jgi:RNA polymerase sigma-70 factor (ECF subfamily)